MPKPADELEEAIRSFFSQVEDGGLVSSFFVVIQGVRLDDEEVNVYQYVTPDHIPPHDALGLLYMGRRQVNKTMDLDDP